MRMKLGVSLVVAALVLASAPAGAQVLTNSLPSGFTALDYAGLVYSAPQVCIGVDVFNNPQFTANVSWDTVVKGPDTFFWYKVSAVSFTNPGDAINRITVNMDTSLVNTIGPVLQYGQFENLGVGANSLVANAASSSALKLSWDSSPGGNQLLTGESIEMWVVSNAPGWTPTSMQLINGGICTAVVPAPAPEPVSMVLAGLGLAAVGAIRRRKA